MPEIILAEGVKAEGLPGILATLLQQNMEQKPHKLKDFNTLDIAVGLKVVDLEMEITLIFERGRLTIDHGLVRNPKLIIVTNSETILELNLVQIKFGFPNYFNAQGRKILKGLISGRLKIKGMITHFVTLTRLTRVMSVNE